MRTLAQLSEESEDCLMEANADLRTKERRTGRLASPADIDDIATQWAEVLRVGEGVRVTPAIATNDHFVTFDKMPNGRFIIALSVQVAGAGVGHERSSSGVKVSNVYRLKHRSWHPLTNGAAHWGIEVGPFPNRMAAEAALGAAFGWKETAAQFAAREAKEEAAYQAAYRAAEDERDAAREAESAAWREKMRPEWERRDAAAAEFRASEAALEADRVARIATGEERRQVLLSMLGGLGANPYGRSHHPALDGFPVDRILSPPAALKAAEAGDFRAAEAWGQEIAAQFDLPERERSFGGVTIARAREARSYPKGR